MNVTKQTNVALHIEEATSFLQRAKGLLGRSQLEQGKALWIKPCNNIHTWFMRFNIDAVFVGRDLKVKAVAQNIKPFRFVWQWNAHSVFELAAGQAQAARIEVGDQLNVVN